MHQKDIHHLAQVYYQNPTAANREALVLASVPLIRSIIGRIRSPKTPFTSYADLQGAGLLGLLEAIERYDINKGTRFTTFAYRRIRGAMGDYLRLVDTVGRPSRQNIEAIQAATDYLTRSSGPPSDVDVAEFVGLSLSKYRELVAYARRQDYLYLHELTAGTNRALIDTIAYDGAPSALEHLEQHTLRDHLTSAVASLTAREQEAVDYYFYQGLNQRQIAQRLDLSEARISQIMKRALKKLREALTPIYA